MQATDAVDKASLSKPEVLLSLEEMRV